MRETDEVRVVGTPKFAVYPRGYTGAGNDSAVWCVVRFEDATSGKTFSATGINLPIQRDVSFELIGQWEDSQKYGRTFQVMSFDVVLPTSEKGVVSYLRSLRVGIGVSKAKRVYARFGEKIWDVLEADPKQLCEVKGISAKVVDRLTAKLEETKVDRELIHLFSGVCEMSATKLTNIKKALGKDAAHVLTDNPYALCLVHGFSFRTADLLGRKAGFPMDSDARISACIGFVFDEAAARGHTCVPKDEFRQMLLRELNRNGVCVTDQRVRDGINTAVKDKKAVVSSGMLYSRLRYEQEVSVCDNIAQMLAQGTDPIEGVDASISAFEAECGICLAASQRDAVRCVFRNQVSIVTGGPGTGKTTVTNAILHVHKEVFGQDSKPLLMAPTGRAARRMTEATGIPAFTIHSVVGFRPEDDRGPSWGFEDMCDGPELDANLVIMDEFSMADLEITCILLERIQFGTRVVFVGDSDQLPSVGCGNVLYELIRSQKVPVSRLSVIFRQAGESPIVANAAKIREGDIDLTRAKGFHVYEEKSSLDMFKRACSLYKKSIAAYGEDNVILLCPYRSKSDLNVDSFNRNLQHIINPANEVELGMAKGGGVTFHERDRVMQMKNTDIARNGDVGVIRRIERVMDPDDPSEWHTQAQIEFNGDGELHAYQESDMRDLDLAYCTTVHKSQGSEYRTVIIVLSRQHTALLRRNIVYTAITRAKENVVIVTEAAAPGDTALDRAILNDKSDNRYTLMADRINTNCKAKECKSNVS